MTRITEITARFLHDEEGASLAEYALLLGVITVALITVITLFRNSISNIFSKTTSAINTA